MIKLDRSEKDRTLTMLGGMTALFTFLITWLPSANAAITCDGRTVEANVVAIDQPVMFNRLGASNINGMIYALRRDVVNIGNATTPI
ncbi:hypothetical protein, partial [Kaarinaea lacus]